MRRWRELRRVSGQLVGHAVVNRQWWLPLVAALIAVGVVLSTAVGAAAPHTLYALF